jgi:hypothetical protein
MDCAGRWWRAWCRWWIARRRERPSPKAFRLRSELLSERWFVMIVLADHTIFEYSGIPGLGSLIGGGPLMLNSHYLRSEGFGVG